MEVPSTLKALWAQRRRWARGQGEVLHRHSRTVVRWRNRRTWYLLVESASSLLWVIALVAALAAAVLNELFGQPFAILGFGLAWGIAIAVVATVQLAFALRLELPYDRRALLAFLAGPIYPVAYWMISGAAALRAEVPAVIHGPRERRVVWDIPREGVGPTS
jgi:biofilm PGA synthesis N-glycosyltransferase PgaC